MPRTFAPSKVDANQPEITAYFRKNGVSVWLTHAVSPGVDCVLGYTRSDGTKVNWLVEIKDGNKPLSQQKLTPNELEFHQSWRGQISIVRSLDDAKILLAKLRDFDEL